MAFEPATAIIELASNVGGKLIDRIFPDKLAQSRERAEAELALLQVQNDQEVKMVTASIATILAEANSVDPWTSRARPSFMYVIYLLLLMSIPMGVLSAISLVTATNIALGFKAWLSAIPDSLYALFGAGYLGYTGARSIEKSKGVA